MSFSNGDEFTPPAVRHLDRPPHWKTMRQSQKAANFRAFLDDQVQKKALSIQAVPSGNLT